MKRAATGLVLALAALACCAAAASPTIWPASLPTGVAPPPSPADNPITPAKVELGRRLFYDADLSIDGTLSCGVCHEQHRAFAEGNATHGGVKGALGRRNVMGLANVGYFPSLTWGDPTLHTLEAQVLVPVLGEHPVEMGMAGKPEVIAERLAGDACYRTQFAAAFPEQGGRIDMPAIARALSAFERTLISFDSPYDRARRNGGTALPDAARRVQALFFGKEAGCAACHGGPTFTDGRFHAIGLYDIDGKGGYPSGDHGLRELTGKAGDEGKFRTPSLRNVVLTDPYMHDGSIRALADAIRAHDPNGSRLRDPKLPRAPLSDAQVADLVAFLQTLTDQTFVTEPALALPKTACGKPL